MKWQHRNDEPNPVGRRTIRSPVAVVAAILLAGILADRANADTYGLPPWMNFVNEWKFDAPATKAAGVAVLRTSAEWDEWWKINGTGSAPKVDFDTQMVLVVVAAANEKSLIYRIELDDAANPKMLVVRTCSSGVSQLPTRKDMECARVHVVVTPKSALPVQFLKDEEESGFCFGEGSDEGVESKEIGKVDGVKITKPENKAEYREQAEKLILESLSVADIEAVRKKIFPKPLGKRYPEPWSVMQVARSQKEWAIEWDGMKFRVEVFSGEVERELEPNVGNR